MTERTDSVGDGARSGLKGVSKMIKIAWKRCLLSAWAVARPGGTWFAEFVLAGGLAPGNVDIVVARVALAFCGTDIWCCVHDGAIIASPATRIFRDGHV